MLLHNFYRQIFRKWKLKISSFKVRYCCNFFLACRIIKHSIDDRIDGMGIGEHNDVNPCI